MHYDGKEAPGGVMPFLAVSGGVLLEIVADIHFQLGAGLELLLPVVVDIHVGREQDLSVFEDVHAVVHAAQAAGGQPHVLGDESGSNDGGFLGLNQGYDSFAVAGEEVLPKRHWVMVQLLGRMPWDLRCAQDYERMRSQFNWTQYKLLISISDPDKREYSLPQTPWHRKPSPPQAGGDVGAQRG